MPTKKENLKRTAFAEIDRFRDRVLEFGLSLWKEPEEGYKEFQSANKVEAEFVKMSIPYESGLAITGVKGCIQGATQSPTVAVLAELDAIINPDHPEANQDTGAIHACGHYTQVASLIATGYGLKSVIDELCGQVMLFAVPAEEVINLSFRKHLRDSGKIKYMGGKQELLRIGAFDDIDMAFMHHGATENSEPGAYTRTTNAFVCKNVRFLGKAVHAGVVPEDGINALHAYQIAEAAINAQRSTFRDEEAVRIHGIVTKGGDSANVVPSEVTVEMYVRARTLDSLNEASLKVDRALRAGGLALGAEVEINTMPGYLPLINNNELRECWAVNTEAVLGKGTAQDRGHIPGSTDMGDLSQVIPCIHPFVQGCFAGDIHGSSFRVADQDTAIIATAKISAAMVIDLLTDSAADAKLVLENFKPGLTKQQYIDLLNSYFRQELYKPH